MVRTSCPLCGRGKPRRTCPALGRQICTVCCGSKRLVEIACPADCSYLASARAHPPATVQRRRDRDIRFLLPLVQDLEEPEGALFVFLQEVILRYAPEAVPALEDRDVAEAAAALAATLETAARGIIYEHRPASLPAQRLLAEIQTSAVELKDRQGGRLLDRQVAVALRRLERAARTAAAELDGGATAYLQLINRLARQSEMDAQRSGSSPDGAPAAPKLILP